MSSILVGVHAPNLPWTEDDYRRLRLSRARVVGVLYTGLPTEGGSRTTRAEYDRIERECPGIVYVLRVGPSRVVSRAEWMYYAGLALAEVPPQVVAEGRLYIRVLNEVNLQSEGAWSPEGYAAFLRAVCDSWPSSVPLVCAPISLGPPDWRDWSSRFIAACGGRVPTERVAVNAYAHLVPDACDYFADLGVPVDVTETGNATIAPGPGRVAWTRDAARAFARAGFATVTQFIVGGDPDGDPNATGVPAWDPAYLMTDTEAEELGRLTNGLVEVVESPAPPVVVVPPTPPEEPVMPAARIQLGIAHRQGNDLPADRQTVAGFIAAHKRAGSRTAIVDCYQGRRIQGTFSQTPVDVTSLPRLAELARALDGEGVAMVAMVNPLGVDPEGEGDDHAAAALTIAEATGKPTWLAVDREHDYDGFWRLPYWEPSMGPKPPPFFPASESPVRWARYTMRLTARLGGVPWHLVPDLRQVGREYPASDTPPGVYFLGQTYWTLFEEPWRTTLEQQLVEWGNAGRYGEHRVLAGIPGAAASVDIRAALAWLIDQDVPRCWVWDLGSLVDYDLDLFGAVADPTSEPLVPAGLRVAAVPSPTPAPAVPPDVVAARDRIYALARELDAAGAGVRAGGTHSDVVLAEAVDGATRTLRNLAIAHKIMRREEAA